jgi:N-acetylneuraminic acid mutarotase
VTIHHTWQSLALAIASLALSSCNDTATEPETAGDLRPSLPAFAVASNSWITRHYLPSTDRWGLATATVPNAAGQSILYAIGGKTNTDGSLSKVQAYNVATDTWTYKASLPKPLFTTNGAGVIRGKVYISGGLSGYQAYQQVLYVYDPATNSWTRKHDMPHPTSGGVTGVLNNQLYVLTNCGVDVCNFSDDLPLFYRYNPVTDEWTSLPTPSNSHHYGVGGFIGGKFYVTGGLRGVGDPKKLDVYDPVTKQWTTRAPIPRQRWLAAGATLAAKLYLIGGFQLTPDGSAAPAVRTTSVYDPATNIWTTKAPMPTARAEISGSRVVFNGKPVIEVVGGAKPDNNLMYTP